MSDILSADHPINMTLSHAKTNCPYYQNRNSYPKNIQALSEFETLPIIDKQEVIENNMQFLDNSSTPCKIKLTSGTTHNKKKGVLLQFVSQQDIETMRSLITMSSEDMFDSKSLSLRLLSVNHGEDFFGGIDGYFALPVETEAHCWAIHKALSASYQIQGFTPHVEMLSGCITSLKAFALFALKEGLHYPKLKQVNVYGFQITDYWKYRLEEILGVEVADLYGVSEIAGLSGIKCSDCGGYTFFHLSHIELVDLTSYKNISHGLGTLLSTTLYPLGSTFPLIRYNTHDLFYKPKSERCGHTYIYFGRERDAIFTTLNSKKKVLLITKLQLNNYLDGMNYVAMKKHYRCDRIGLEEPFGWLEFDISLVDNSNEVRIELNTIDGAWNTEQNEKIKSYALKTIVDNLKLQGIENPESAIRLDITLEKIKSRTSNYAAMI
ncbi:MAG: hypothetical protein AAGA77_01890 [Bacteroidota bacterium]